MSNTSTASTASNAILLSLGSFDPAKGYTPALDGIELEYGDNLLSGMYRHINCSTVAIGGSATINDFDVTLWVDDEGLYRPNDNGHLMVTDWSDVCDYGQAELAGNVLITGGEDDDGNTIPLTPEQVATAIEYMRSAVNVTIYTARS